MKNIHPQVNRGFVALHRGEVINSLLEHYPDAVLLLTQIALRARWQPCKVTGLNQGEAMIGDFKKAGLTERRYRTAKKRLANTGIVTFKATTSGTIATLADTSVFSVFMPESDGQSDGQDPKKRRTGDGRATTKNKGNKENTKPFFSV